MNRFVRQFGVALVEGMLKRAQDEPNPVDLLAQEMDLGELFGGGGIADQELAAAQEEYFNRLQGIYGKYVAPFYGKGKGPAVEEAPKVISVPK